jgi:hypothetical protein
MTVLTALIIQTRGKDIHCDAGGPDKTNKKYCGWLTLYNGDEYDHELVSTDPVFDTAEAAKKYMQDLVAEVRKMDLSIEGIAKHKEEAKTKMKYIANGMPA